MTLNEAWYRFWTAPDSFAAWEKEVTEALIPTQAFSAADHKRSPQFPLNKAQSQ